jgi:hypothetical protein
MSAPLQAAHAAHQPDTERHGPVPTTWFGIGCWPSCKCGYDPHDNGLLNAHWREHGFEVVDDHGHLVCRPVAS